MLYEYLVSGFPCIADAGGLSIGKGDGMNGVGVLVIQDKNVVVTTTGRDGKFACLIRVRFEKCFLGNKGSANLMGSWFKCRCNVGVCGEGKG